MRGIVIFCCASVLTLGSHAGHQQIISTLTGGVEIGKDSIDATEAEIDRANDTKEIERVNNNVTSELTIDSQHELNDKEQPTESDRPLPDIEDSDELLDATEKKKRADDATWTVDDINSQEDTDDFKLASFAKSANRKDVIRKGAYTYYLNKDKSIKYASFTSGGYIARYYQYAPRTKYSQVTNNKIKYVAYMRKNNTISHVREYTKGNWQKVFTFPANTKINQNKKYWQGRTTTFYLKGNRKDGLLSHAAHFNSRNKIDIYYQFFGGTKYTNYSDKKIQYRAFVNANGTIKHVREYKNGYWTKAFEFAKNTKINQKKRYWQGRRTTFYLKANRKDGLLTSATQFSGSEVTAKYTYLANTFYGKGHGKRIKSITAPKTKWVMPVKKGIVTCILERCIDGAYGGRHNGTDIGNNNGASVYSMASGKVTESKYFGALGNIVGVYYRMNGQDYYVVYAHLQSRKVKVGQQVKAGQILGNVGGTGGPYPAHLHVEVLKGVKSFIGSGPERRKKAVGLDKVVPIRLKQRLG